MKNLLTLVSLVFLGSCVSNGICVREDYRQFPYRVCSRYKDNGSCANYYTKYEMRKTCTQWEYPSKKDK